jgi:hypothetical protein
VAPFHGLRVDTDHKKAYTLKFVNKSVGLELRPHRPRSAHLVTTYVLCGGPVPGYGGWPK